VSPDGRRLITGSADTELRLWDLEKAGQPSGVVALGKIRRQSKERVVQLRYSGDGSKVGCVAADKTLEVFRVRSAAEVQHRITKRERQRKKKKKDAAAAAGVEVVEEEEEELPVAALEVAYESMVVAPARIRSFAFAKAKGSDDVMVALHNNTLHVYQAVKGETGKKLRSVERTGHSSGIRAVAMSADSVHVCSVSKESTKVWAVTEGEGPLRLVQRLEPKDVLCVSFVVSHNYVLLGSHDGSLSLCDVGAGTVVHEVPEAHEGKIWSLVCSYNGKVIVTGGSDKMVKFWKLGLSTPSEAGAKHPVLIHTRTLTMTDEVLSVAMTANGKLVCVAMLDSTVKVFYEDSLKFFLSLYGHKLPVLAMDAADDSTLLVTASADKSVKLWGLDFGDCHRSLHAHDDSVTGVKFLPGTHYFFTTGKDKMVKYWDGDKREQILALPGHHAEVWGAAISHTGDLVVTGSNDRSLRLWHRTEDQVYVEEEKENALEELFDAGLDDNAQGGDGGARVAVPGVEGDGSESGLAAKKSMESVKSGERLFEAMELAEQAEKEEQAHIEAKVKAEALIRETGRDFPIPTKPEPNILLLGRTGRENLMHVLKSIRSAELQQALLLLPLDSTLQMLHHCKVWLEEGTHVELACRCCFFLLRVHHNQITAGHHSLVQRLQELGAAARKRLREEKELVGLNMAAMNYMRREMEEESSAAFFGTAMQSLTKRLKVKR